jgi:general secretion pathway protein G
VVVFAVGGITDKGTTSACKADKKTYEVAIEAYYAQEGAYPASETVLDSTGFIRDVSTMYNVGSGGTVTVQDAKCSGV